MHFVLATSSGELGTLALGLVISGVFAGLIAGSLGVDIGIVVVPVLYHVLALIGVDESLRMHLAIGTSLAAIIPISLASFLRPNEDSAIDRKLLRRWSVPMFIGVSIGCALVVIASGRTLALVFACVALLVALYFAFGGETRRIVDRLPEGTTGLAMPAAIGGISAMMGIGGGTLGVPAMTLCGVPLPRAIPTASAFGAIVAIPGAIAAILTGRHAPGLPPYSLGYVNLLGVVLIAPASFLIAPVGAALGHMTDGNRLRILFALFIVLMTGRMLYDAFG
jgi:uncharacterized membrane protein YfcA